MHALNVPTSLINQVIQRGRILYDEDKLKEIRNWLIKSQHDLGSAKRPMEGDEQYLDMAVYHCQQAAEKAIKAYLIYRDVIFEKTHNLVVLLFECVSLDSQFLQWREVAKMLTPYSSKFRYPRELWNQKKMKHKKPILQQKHLWISLLNYCLMRSEYRKFKRICSGYSIEI